MTDKEFKRLSRSQLIEIIYQFQLKQDELIAENERLSKELADKRLRITQAGNIAEAALAVNNVMQDAQNAAQQYLDEIRAMHSELDGECQRIRAKAKEEAAEIVAKARKEAAAMTGYLQKNTAPNHVHVEEPVTVASVPVVQKEAAVEVAAEVEVSILPDEKILNEDDVLLEEILCEFGTMSEV